VCVYEICYLGEFEWARGNAFLGWSIAGRRRAVISRRHERGRGTAKAGHISSPSRFCGSRCTGQRDSVGLSAGASSARGSGPVARDVTAFVIRHLTVADGSG